MNIKGILWEVSDDGLLHIEMMCGIGQSGQNCQIKPPEFIRYQTGGLGGTICLTIFFKSFGGIFYHFDRSELYQTFFQCEQDF